MSNPNLSGAQFPKVDLNPEQPKPFSHLRRESKNSILQYMAEGEVEDVDQHLSRFDFVERREPLEQVAEGVMQGDDVKDIAPDFEGYHRWYADRGDLPQHTERWPSIRSNQPEWDGYFEDGWHRFHSYVAQGDKTIPTVQMQPRTR